MTSSFADTLPPSGLMLTDGGLETVLIFEHGLDLPEFAAFPLVETDEGRSHLTKYFDDYLRTAAEFGAGFVLETPTWRANADWGATLGYGPDDLRRVNQLAADLALGLRAGWTSEEPLLVSGCLGPRGDGYVPGSRMTPDEAAEYHRPQIAALADAGVDLVTTFTYSYSDEAAGVVAAAAQVGIPVVAGFTVETDGRLPSGETLAEAVAKVDTTTGNYTSWFMVNCAHPEHVAAADIDPTETWVQRIGAVRSNASRLSHAELDEAEELDAGDPLDLAASYVQLSRSLPAVKILGGCCGTNVAHVRALAASVTGPA